MNEVERYIQQFDADVRDQLNVLRRFFFEVNPDTEECIRYKIPSFKVGKEHLYFAAFKKHIGFYPVYGLLNWRRKSQNIEVRGPRTVYISS